MLTLYHLLQGIQNTDALARVSPCLLLLLVLVNAPNNEYHYEVSYMYSIIFGLGGFFLIEVFIMGTLYLYTAPHPPNSFHVLPRVLQNKEVNSSLLIVKYKKKV